MATKVSDSMLKEGVAIPPGAVMSFAVSAAPVGWLACDGTSKPVSDFQPLFTAIGYTYGGSGSTFNVPNLQGQFVRGLTTNQSTASRDPLSASRVLGNVQGDAFEAHSHDITDPGHNHVWNAANGPGGANYGVNYVAGISTFVGFTQYTVNSRTTGITVNNSGDTENRPVNIALLYCIKY